MLNFSSDALTWILVSVISIQAVLLGFFLRFLFLKASRWGDEQRETNKQLALIHQTLSFQKERTDKHDDDISSIQSRMAVISDRIGRLITTFELVRFIGCKEDCPIANAIERAQDTTK